jgi:hypothetical protein
MKQFLAGRLAGRSEWLVQRAQLFGASKYLDCPVCAREAGAVYAALGVWGSLDLDKPIRALFPSSWIPQEGGALRGVFLGFWLEQLLGPRMAKRKVRLRELMLRSARQIIDARARVCGGCTCPRH